MHTPFVRIAQALAALLALGAAVVYVGAHGQTAAPEAYDPVDIPVRLTPMVLVPMEIPALKYLPIRGLPMPLGESRPERLLIPGIDVDTDLMDLGLNLDGSLEVPPEGFPAGWYTGGPTPGEPGPAVIAGHVDWRGPGVFHHLDQMEPGDEVIIVRADNSVVVFRVTKVMDYPKDEFPTAAVYGDIDFAGLRLITCGGLFDSSTGHYEDNLVVFATLVSSTRPMAI